MTLNTNRLVGILFVLLLTWIGARPAASADLLLDKTWGEDFESGTISGWESYPAFEDTAYDFTILPGRYHDRYALQGYIGSGEFFYPVDLAPPTTASPNTTYLLRAYRPNSASSQVVGATIKVWANVAPTSQLDFDYWLKNISDPSGIEVQVACGDGRRYVAPLATVTTGQWTHATVKLADMRADGIAPAAGTTIQALALVASFAKGDPSAYIFFCLDNVALTCRAQAGFNVTQPETEAFKHWPMLFAKRHYHPGDSVSLAATPAATLTSVTARVENIDGTTILGPVNLSQSAGQWSGSLGAFKTGDVPGPHTIVIEGTESTGKRARSDTRVWLLKDVAAGTHPRLFFGASDIPALQARRTSGDGANGWSTISSMASSQPVVATESINQYYPRDYLVPDQTAYKTWTSALANPEQAIFYNAFAYAIGGTSSKGNYARDGVVKMAGWDMWNHPWFEGQGRYDYYPVGRATQSCAFAYDAVYGLLSSQQRADVCRGIMKNGVIPAWTEWFRDDRVGNNTSNWIHHATSGAVEALIAMEGELTGDDAANWDIYFSGLMEKEMALPRHTLHEDGAWGEDFSYQDYAQAGGQPMFAALKQAYGVTGLVQSLRYTIGHIYPLYASFNGGSTMLPMGDSHESRSQSYAWVWFARESNDPVYRSFVNNVPIKNKWEDFLWRDTTQPMQSPAEAGWPKSRVFPGKGNVVFRSGWDNDDIVLVYRGGPNYNHTHADQGNFIMSVGDQQLIAEAGCGSYYYQDPYFWSYFTQAAGHNVILVDGNPESQATGDFMSEIKAFNNYAHTDRTIVAGPTNFFSSQLGHLYRGALSEWTRRIYFVDPGCAVVCDTMKSTDPHRFMWQLFPPNKDALQIDNASQATIAKGSYGVRVNVIGGSGAALSVADKPMPLTNYINSSWSKRAALQLVNTAKSTSQSYLVALIPVKGAPLATVTEVSGAGYKGVKLDMGTTQTTVVVGSSINGDITSNGPSASVTKSGGAMSSAAFEFATRATLGGVELFSSNKAINVGIVRSGPREIWTFNAAEAATVVATASGGVHRTLSVPAGDSTFIIDASSSTSPAALEMR